MNAAKQQFELVPAAALVDIQQYSSPVVATSAIRLAARLRLADRMAPPVNVIISNVPGPRQPLYMDGAQLQQYIPVSTIGEGMGLNITVHSYLDELVFGLVSCRELVPDLWDMVDMHIDEIAVLFDATGAEWAEPPRPAPPRHRIGDVHPASKPAAKKAARRQAAHRPSATKEPPEARTPTAHKKVKASAAKRAPEEDEGRRGQASSHQGQGDPPPSEPRGKAKAAAQ